MKTSVCVGLVVVLASAASIQAKQPLVTLPLTQINRTVQQVASDVTQDLSFASRGRNHPEDVVSNRFNNLNMQLNIFVNEPSVFATFFPAEYCFFYRFGIQTGLLTSLSFDRSVYDDLFTQLSESEFGSFFTGVNSYNEACYIDYLYVYLVYHFNLATDDNVRSNDDLFGFDDFSRGLDDAHASDRTTETETGDDNSSGGGRPGGSR